MSVFFFFKGHSFVIVFLVELSFLIEIKTNFGDT